MKTIIVDKYLSKKWKDCSHSQLLYKEALPPPTHFKDEKTEAQKNQVTSKWKRLQLAFKTCHTLVQIL